MAAAVALNGVRMAVAEAAAEAGSLVGAGVPTCMCSWVAGRGSRKEARQRSDREQGATPHAAETMVI